jgi:molybdopterin-guanine dinucleotide biosynthesis protein A
MNIGCAILAGGKSSRMGRDKALLEYDGKQFIQQITEELSQFEERIIARGTNRGFSAEIEAAWTVIPDLYPDHGPIGGLHAALSACRSDALFVVTCDMPLIESELVRELCAWMQETDVDKKRVDAYDVVISVGEGGKIHPLCGVYRKSVLPVLEEQILSDRNRVMAALKQLRVKYVTVDSPARARQLANINTPEDYHNLMKP